MEVCWEDAEEMELETAAECSRCCSWEEMEIIEGVIIWEETMEEVIMMEIEHTYCCCWCDVNDNDNDGGSDCYLMECVNSSGNVVMIDDDDDTAAPTVLDSLYNKYRLLLMSDLAGSFMDWEDVTGDAIMVPVMWESS